MKGWYGSRNATKGGIVAATVTRAAADVSTAGSPIAFRRSLEGGNRDTMHRLRLVFLFCQDDDARIGPRSVSELPEDV
jgi:hypothetical protein